MMDEDEQLNYPDILGLPLRVWIQCVPEVPLDDQVWTWSQWVVETSDPDPEMYLPGETVIDVQYARADVFDALLEAVKAYEHAEMLNAVYGTEPYDEDEDDGDEIFRAFMKARELAQAAIGKAAGE